MNLSELVDKINNGEPLPQLNREEFTNMLKQVMEFLGCTGTATSKETTDFMNNILADFNDKELDTFIECNELISKIKDQKSVTMILVGLLIQRMPVTYYYELSGLLEKWTEAELKTL